MEKLKRLISTLLTVCMLFGAMTGLFTFEVFAADEDEDEIDWSEVDFTTEAYYTAEEKLATMEMRFEKGDYQIWVHEYTGEVVVVNTATGEKLFTNPYDVGLSKSTASVKAELLSQILIEYTGNEVSGVQKFTSFSEAASNGQIKIKSIKNGVRVEYTIGREETKYLVPRLIEKDRFVTLIREPMRQVWESLKDSTNANERKIANDLNKYFGRFDNDYETFYVLQDPEEFADSPLKLSGLYRDFPITATLGAVYSFDAFAGIAEIEKIEGYIKTYCPAYTYEEMDYDHERTEYTSADQNPAVFKMALEYTLDEMGLSVTLPANGIRFDESLYQLSNVTILPYMGAGMYSAETLANTGYTFLPDGSGAIFRFEDLAASGGTIGGPIYGQDYAYHTITSSKYQETLRMPVYGVVQDNLYSYEKNTTTGLYDIVENKNPTSSGFFAIIEEGDALAEIRSRHLGKTGEYHSVQVTVKPRPYDTYNVADAISVSNATTWTVVSDRKYVGNYTIRYIMLTDDAIAAEKGLDNTYSANYFGMAEAYRDYLTSPYSTGTQKEAVENQSSVLTRLEANQVESDITLYLETFGAMETVEKVLSVPVTVMTPLTTFDDIRQIYEDLSQESVGIGNINFKLTGYANGGLYSTIPYKLEWEKAVGGKSGFEDLMAYANGINGASATDGKNLGIYPDFDFANVKYTSSFDGFSLKKHALKTIDDRYTGKRTYSATFQTYESDGSLAVSPAYFSRFYDKLASKYLKFSADETGADLGISVSTLGTDLNSDFDEDEPYNREDSKQFTVDAVKALSESYGKVMTTGGNAYTWQYVDYILDLPIDGSRYLSSSNSIPFTGIVLHGFLEYAGGAINMEGNIQYGILRAIENGASLYFILTYDNATELKEDYYFSQYYSVRYDIWAGQYNDEGEFEAGELVDIYNTLNSVTNDLQTKLIIDHELLVGQRIPDADEVEADAKAEEEAKKLAEEQAAKEAAETFRRELLEARVSAISSAKIAASSAKNRIPRETTFKVNLSNIKQKVELIEKTLAELEALGEDEDPSKLEAQIESAKKEIERIYTNFMSSYTAIMQSQETVADKARIVETAVEYFKTSGIYSQAFIDDTALLLDEIAVVVEEMNETVATIQGYQDSILEIAKAYLVTEEEEDADGEEEDGKVAINERYLLDDGSIVAVTYGEEGEPYRTFILNYNYFTVSVEYNGETYEIDRYGFEVIDHEN